MANMALIRICVLLLFMHLSQVKGVCKDKLHNCDQYSPDICTSFEDWSYTNCAKTCQFCENYPDATPYVVNHCPTGWNSSESDRTCFKSFGTDDKATRISWYNAIKECERNGAKLAMIRDAEKNSAVAATLDSGIGYWIGLKNVGFRDVWKLRYANKEYTDTSRTAYANWDLVGLRDDHIIHCVAMRQSGKWGLPYCFEKKPFVCQKPSAAHHCSTGWNYIDSDGTCYKTFGMDKKASRLTWFNADRYCKTNGAILVTVKDGKKNTAISDALDSRLDYWIGVTALGFEERMAFQYVDQTNMSDASYTNWGKNQPNNYGDNQHCVYIRQNGKWSDSGCLGKRPFVCQKQLADHCSPGWNYTDSDGMCIKTFGMDDKASRMNWYNATRECKKNDAMLVMIKDATTNTVISATLDVKFSYWVGLRNKGHGKEMDFHYVDKTRMSIKSYTNWDATEPDNRHDTQHCVRLLATGKWSDHGCLHQYPFICQKKKNA